MGLKQQIFKITTAVAVVGAYVLSANHLGSTSQVASNGVSMPPLVEFNPIAVQALTFGHKGLYDDLLTTWVSHQLIQPGVDPESVLRVVRAASQHEPRLETFYMFSCIMLTEVFGHKDACLELTTIGLKAMPSSWRIPMTQAYIYRVHYKDNEKAAAFYNLAAAQTSAPEDLRKAASVVAAGRETDDVANDAVTLMLAASGGMDLREIVERFAKDRGDIR